MALPAHLQKFADNPIKVLDDGHVKLVDVMGDDQAVVDAARVSYGEGTKRVTEDRHLIRYLLRHTHTTPFEMCEIKLRVRVPFYIWKQWMRHRTASINEVSYRYSEAIDSMEKTDPDAWRLQATDNKQGSSGFLTKWPENLGFRQEATMDCPEGAWLGEDYYPSPGSYLSERESRLQDDARELYKERLAFGVAKEEARKDLPLSTYTEAYWKVDLHNLFHFLALRMDAHAQAEIRAYANAIAEIVKVWVPWCWEAFEDYNFRRGAKHFSRLELKGLQAVLQGYMDLLLDNGATDEDEARKAILSEALTGAGVKGREAKEFEAKLLALLG